MSNYDIEVTRYAASIHRIDGSELSAELFLDAVEGTPARSFLQHLCAPETVFLPVRIDGQNELVQRASIVYIASDVVERDMAQLEEVGAAATEVELVLCTGESLSGDLVYEASSDNRRRVSDLFNTNDRLFFPLVTKERTLLVRRGAVHRVRFGGN